MRKGLIETASVVSLLSFLAFSLPAYAQDTGSNATPTESGEAASQGEELLDCPPGNTDPACLEQGQSTGGSGDSMDDASDDSMDGSSSEGAGGMDSGGGSGESSGGSGEGSSSGGSSGGSGG